MRYWVYINDKVMEKPFEEGELASIPGFNSNTLICKETPAEGETQEWVPAKNLIAAYRQPAPPPPPTQQNINKFRNEDNYGKEQPQATILSSNIFGSSNENKINLYTSEMPANNSEEKNDFTQTESIFPQEQASFEEDISAEPTELVSIDDVKEVDVDNHELLEDESEDDILKTAIKKLITPVDANKSAGETFEAIDIAHNRNIDLSEPQEENIDKLVAGLNNSKKGEDVSNNESSEEKKKDIANTELTLMGASKTGINHLFSVDDQAEPNAELSVEQPVEQTAQEENIEEAPVETVETAEQPVEQTAQEENIEETPVETGESVEQPVEQITQEENTEETPVETVETAEQPVEQIAQEENTEETPVETVEQPVEQNVQEEQNPLSEDEFVPEEEISLEEDDFVVEDLNNNDKDVLTKEEPSAKEQEVLKELAADKEEDLKVAQEEEAELSEAFKTAPAMVSDLQQDNNSEEIIQESNNVLETSQEEKPVEEFPTTLEELTGKTSLPQQAEVKEENQDEGFVPAEVHPDIIVEEVKEEGKEEEPTNQEVSEEKPEDALEKDNFLNTFSSDIETVFLDQPTAFISDYIPPEATKDLKKEIQQEQKEVQEGILDIKSSQGQHQVQNVRRVKPAAIKTVPMVDGEQIDPFSQTQIRNIEVAEENMIRIEKKNDRMNIVLTISLIVILIFMVIGFFGLIAQFGILPKDFSPIHVVISKVFKKNTDKAKETNTKLTPEELALKDLKEAETLRINRIIDEVKNYKLMEGKTLEEKIKLLHPNVYDTLKWEASQLPTDLTYYSVTITSPANQEGFSQVNYRFNYNTVTYSVEATTSESNNVMVTPYKAPATTEQKK